MKTFQICILFGILMACTATAFARGITAPPPPYLGLGNAGGWLGSGPLTGFDTPLGGDWPGNSDGNGGTIGFGWSPAGSSSGGSSSSPSGACACRCQDPVPLGNGLHGEVCENHCLCLSLHPNSYGPTIGSCKDYGRRCGQGGTCCAPTDSSCYF
jgi:hypothetical protein